nr:sodium/calcium exchanger NCL-like [Ipomoea batatas]
MLLKTYLTLLPLLLLSGGACGLPLGLVSDGGSAGGGGECEQTYGFLPCTHTALGNLFLIIVYGYLMYLAATYLSSGSELLLQLLGPGLIGGLFLPILGALPDAMLILVSGLSGSAVEAQSQVSVGMGLLAGSTVMLLTVIWGTCVLVGKCDIQNSVAVDLRDTKGYSFTVVQLPQLLHSSSGRHLTVLIALVLSLSLLISYCLYQVFQPWIQARRLAYSKHKHVVSGVLKQLKMHALGRLSTDQGTPNLEVLQKLFKRVDENGDGRLSQSELKALVVGISLDGVNLDETDAVEKVMKDFDTSNDGEVDFGEFVAGVDKWLDEFYGSRVCPESISDFDYFQEQTKREHYLLGDQSDEATEGVENPKWTSIKAASLLLLGTAIAAAFADPLVDAVDNFSTATKIPSFFISFVALPLATNSSEAGINVGLHIGSAGYPHCVRCDGCVWRHALYISTLDFLISISSLSLLYCSGICPGFQMRLDIAIYYDLRPC